MPALSKLDLLVVQPTPFCNLDCSYCYLPERTNKGRMQHETLKAVGRSILGSPCFSDNATLVWHAGEPCVLPANWYSEACDTLQTQSGRIIRRQAFQTNATRIDDDWIAYFSQPGVSVGVSLDGPPDINDRWRVDRRGKGTYARTMEGIARLRSAGIPFHIICVVTSAALESPERVASTLAQTGCHTIGINVEEVEGIHQNSSLTEKHRARYREFLRRFVGTLAQLESPPRLREMDRVRTASSARKFGQRLRSQENTPGAIVSVGLDGDISSFSPELLGQQASEYDNFRFGNVHKINELSEIYLSRAFLRSQHEISRGVARCRTECAYFGVCGGGSPSNKLGETGTLGAAETLHCMLTVKDTFDALLDPEKATKRLPQKEKTHV
ncbi:MAG: cyclophane-forming radical SAM/SPASM peptide maturase GrrM/OscB [Pseudomonadota bacterium]